MTGMMQLLLPAAGCWLASACTALLLTLPAVIWQFSCRGRSGGCLVQQTLVPACWCMAFNCSQ